jgi:hypothetical protein
MTSPANEHWDTTFSPQPAHLVEHAARQVHADTAAAHRIRNLGVVKKERIGGAPVVGHGQACTRLQLEALLVLVVLDLTRFRAFAAGMELCFAALHGSLTSSCQFSG